MYGDQWVINLWRWPYREAEFCQQEVLVFIFIIYLTFKITYLENSYSLLLYSYIVT